jgi:aminoglycoside phosphotransferase (APT) family kinase protein
VVEDMGIPDDLNAVSAEWMTAALARSHPKVEVDAVVVLLRDDGTNRRVRLGLTYSRGAGPATVFVKASDPEHAALNAATGGLLNEARLFACEAHLPVDHPEVYLSLVDEEGLDFMMVMEDVVARGCDPRDATRPLTIDQAARGAASLARLHSAYWGNRLRGHAELSWVEPFTTPYRLARGIDIGLERAGDTIPGEVQRLGGVGIERQWQAFTATVLDGPQTLLHGDPHIGNTYVLPDDGVGFLDWQVVRSGNPVLDLGYFVQGALTIDDRRDAEMDLVDTYLDALDLPAGGSPTREEVRRRYRASAAYGLAIWLATAASSWQRPEVSLALAERYAAAFVDLEAAAAIDEVSGRV